MWCYKSEYCHCFFKFYTEHFTDNIVVGCLVVTGIGLVAAAIWVAVFLALKEIGF